MLFMPTGVNALDSESATEVVGSSLDLGHGSATDSAGI